MKTSRLCGRRQSNDTPADPATDTLVDYVRGADGLAVRIVRAVQSSHAGAGRYPHRDAYVISLLPVTALSDAPDHGFLIGNYTGHRWPGNLPDDQPARIEIAADNPRLLVLQTCSHELQHFELEQAGVAAVKHHEMMAEEDTNFVYPWNWNPGCFRIFPHILY